MENLTCITFIISIATALTVFFTVGVWKFFDWCKLKSELKHKEKMENIRINMKKESERIESNKEILKKEIAEELKEKIGELFEEKFNDIPKEISTKHNIEEVLAKLQSKISSINFK